MAVMKDAFWGEEPQDSVATVHADQRCEMCGGRAYVRIMQAYEITDERDKDGLRKFRVTGEQIVPWYMTDAQALDMYQGMTLTANNCNCLNKARAQQWIEAALGQPNVPEDCRRFNFRDFEQLEHARAALPALRKFAGGGKLDKPGIMLSGPTGVGKTTLAAVTFIHRVKEGEYGVWLNFNDLIEKIRWTYANAYSGPSQEQIIGAVITARLLVIDDLGSVTRSDQGKKELYAEDAIEAMRKIADHRLSKNLPTLITTNLSREQLYAQFGPRVVSRLRGLCQGIEMIGPDFRTAKE